MSGKNVANSAHFVLYWIYDTLEIEFSLEFVSNARIDKTASRPEDLHFV